MKKLVYGVGVNDADYVVQIKETVIKYARHKLKQKLIWVCPFYSKWIGMLERCYSEKYIAKRPTYQNCFVCEGWLTFSNFKAWMEQQDYEGKQLDKDLLVRGNKVYSPDTCLFVSAQVNSFIIDCTKSRGEYAIGVHWDKRHLKYSAQIQENGKRKHLGYFNTQEEAHQAWLKSKLKLAHELAAKQSDPRVAAALISRYENYED